jgi:hypothetical protein
VAKRTRPDVRPHTAICATMAELRTVLAGAGEPPAHATAQAGARP